MVPSKPSGELDFQRELPKVPGAHSPPIHEKASDMERWALMSEHIGSFITVFGLGFLFWVFYTKISYTRDAGKDLVPAMVG